MQDRIVIKDMSILDKMLDELEKEHEAAVENTTKVNSYVNDALSKVNKDVSSMQADLSKMGEEMLKKDETIRIVGQLKQSFTDSINDTFRTLQENNDALAKKIDALSKLVSQGGAHISTLDSKIEDLREEIKKINVDRYPSADELADYTAKIANSILSFANTNKSNYANFSEATKSLFKKVIVTADTVKKKGPEIKKNAAKMLSEALTKPIVKPQPATGLKATGGTQPARKPVHSTPVKGIPSVDAYARKLSFERKNKNQNLAVSTMISLLVLFGLVSYIMVSGKYMDMSLGILKVAGFVWKLSTLLISIDAYVILVFLIIRCIATAYCYFVDGLPSSKKKIQKVIISVVFLGILVWVGKGIREDFYTISKDYLRYKDILLTNNIHHIGGNIRDIFSYWRAK